MGRRYLGFLGVLLITLIVFGRVVSFPFISFDDGIHVYGNPGILNPSLSALRQFWSSTHQAMYIPVTYSFWLFESWLGGALNSSLFHTSNLLLHLANVVGVMILVGLLGLSRRICLLVAALFALHPVQVEPVAWVTGTKDLLSGFFAILASISYLLSKRCPSTFRPERSRVPEAHPIPFRPKSRWAPFWVGVVFFGLSLLAKPAHLLMPVVLGILSVVFLQRSPRRTVAEMGVWLLVAIPAAVVISAIQSDTGSIAPVPWWQRLFVASDAIQFYFAKILFPAQLSFDYGRIPTRLLESWTTYVTPLFPVGILALAFRIDKRFGAMILAAILFLLPVLGFVPFSHQKISTTADRYLYLALVPIGIALALALEKVAPKRYALIGVAVVAALAVRSFIYVGDWSRSDRLYEAALATNPRSHTAHVNLANIRARLAEGKSDRTTQALGLAERSARVTADIRAGLIKQAHEHYEKAMAIDSDDSMALTSYGMFLMRHGRKEDAITLLRKAAEGKNPTAEALANYGLHLVENGQGDAGAPFLERAMRSQHPPAEVFNSYGMYRYSRGDKDGAAQLFAHATEQDPTFGEAFNNLGVTLLELGRESQAIEAMVLGFSRAPTEKRIHENLRRLLARESARPQVIAQLGQLSMTPLDKKFVAELITER